MVKQEFQLFDLTENRSSNIIRLGEALKTIPPTSAEAERTLSSAGLFTTKLRIPEGRKLGKSEALIADQECQEALIRTCSRISYEEDPRLSALLCSAKKNLIRMDTLELTLSGPLKDIIPNRISKVQSSIIIILIHAASQLGPNVTWS
ncbi:hypothetical protein AVEN_79875-1 [Araneus ventricosus]|uniref:Uncharacterized protein n=1 Tax=Araneus ventricosus TaxID=182803 RepID=A0A4Y2DTW8_ARAVE|nr:hypothetical protein AVEN_79875-1 [Araneus ventricosus]